MDENKEKSIHHFIVEVLKNTRLNSLLIHDDELSDNLVLLLYRLKLAGYMKITDISAAFHLTPAAATNMCDKLERMGLVERVRLNEDRRVVRVTLTKLGAEKIYAMFAGLSISQLEVITSNIEAINNSVKAIEQII
ncbi:MarR family transcriptional regulator [Cytobacillus horneckiae]|uniref:MarR family transcriptional regulator n=1 Tax=Cytobacillus horneckiae TaxID=549687 RepID=UPI003D25FB64